MAVPRNRFILHMHACMHAQCRNAPIPARRRVQGPLQPLRLGCSGDLEVGQRVYAIGNPFGLDHTLTSGIISGTGREISSGNTGRPIQDVIQTDAAVRDRCLLLLLLPQSSQDCLVTHSTNLLFLFAADQPRQAQTCLVESVDTGSPLHCTVALASPFLLISTAPPPSCLPTYLQATAAARCWTAPGQ